MQIIIFSLILILVLIYIIYKIKSSFSKKELLGFLIIVMIVIASSIYINNKENNKLPQAFKDKYLNDKNIEIKKLSMSQTNIQVLTNAKLVFDLVYIINKNGKDYVCEAKNVEVLTIEDEYIFKAFKEDCKIK